MLEKPPVFDLEPPPLLPFPIEWSSSQSNKSKILLNSNDLNEFLKCSRENIRKSDKQESPLSTLNNLFVSFKNELFNSKSSSGDTTSSNNSYLLISLVVITILIVFLITFILFAFVYIRRFKRNKYGHTSINKNSSTSNSLINNVFNTSSPATVSSLTFNSSLTPPLSQSSKSSVTSEFNELTDVILNDHQLSSYKIATASRMIPNQFNPTSLFPISSRNTHNDSANTTNTTIDTFNSRQALIPNRTMKPNFNSSVNRIQPSQQQQDQHYYESIGDPSQFYFDVDQQTASFCNPLLSMTNKRSPIVLTPSTVSMTLNDESYPNSCSNCTLLKLNNNKLTAHQRQHVFQNDSLFQQSNVLSHHNPTQANMTNQFLKSLIV